MNRETFVIKDPAGVDGRPQDNTSFRKYIWATLVFVYICLLIVMIVVLRRINSSENTLSDEISGDKDTFYGSRLKTTLGPKEKKLSRVAKNIIIRDQIGDRDETQTDKSSLKNLYYIASLIKEKANATISTSTEGTIISSEEISTEKEQIIELTERITEKAPNSENTFNIDNGSDEVSSKNHLIDSGVVNDNIEATSEDIALLNTQFTSVNSNNGNELIKGVSKSTTSTTNPTDSFKLNVRIGGGETTEEDTAVNTTDAEGYDLDYSTPDSRDESTEERAIKSAAFTSYEFTVVNNESSTEYEAYNNHFDNGTGEGEISYDTESTEIDSSLSNEEVTSIRTYLFPSKVPEPIEQSVISQFTGDDEYEFFGSDEHNYVTEGKTVQQTEQDRNTEINSSPTTEEIKSIGTYFTSKRLKSTEKAVISASTEADNLIIAEFTGYDDYAFTETIKQTETAVNLATTTTKKTVSNSRSTVRQSTEKSTEMNRNQDNQTNVIRLHSNNFTDNENTQFLNKNECNTNTCKSTASRILSLIDHSQDYCEDFYKYSCGGLITETEDDYLKDVWKQMHKVVRDSSPSIFIDRFQAFYESCVAHEKKFVYRSRVQAVKEIIKGVGEIILDEDIMVDKVKFTNLMAKLVLMGSFPVMEVNIDVDSITHKYVIQITLPDKNLKAGVMNDWSTLLEVDKRCLSQKQIKFEDILNLAEVHNSILDCRKDYTSFLNGVENTIREINFYSELDQQNIAEKTQDNLFTIGFDILQLVDDVKVPDIQDAIMNKNYEEVKITDLQKKWKVIDWKIFFKELVGYALPDDTSLHVYFYDKIDKVMQKFEFMLSRKDRSRSLYNALLVLYATDIYQNTVVPKHKENREKYCLELSSYLFHDVSTYVYMNSPKGKETKVQEDTILNIFNILKSHLINATIESNSFEDPNVTVQKVDKLQVHFASKSKECLNRQKLTKKYSASNEIGQSFAKNLIWSMEFHRRHSLALAGRTFNEMDMFCYFLHPYDVKPKSFYAKEIIAVPYGILRNIPDDEPGYVLMARVGIHLAQGIGMHFDPVGITCGMNLSENDADTYIQLKDFFLFDRIRIVNKQSIVFEKTHLTTNKEIADNMGLRMISDTYNQLQNNIDLPWMGNSFTQEQIFFISAAQEFCEKVDVVDYMLDIYERGTLPAPMRVEIMLATSKEFVDVFKCAEGTTMNNGEVAQVQFPYLEI